MCSGAVLKGLSVPNDFFFASYIIHEYQHFSRRLVTYSLALFGICLRMVGTSIKNIDLTLHYFFKTKLLVKIRNDTCQTVPILLKSAKQLGFSLLCEFAGLSQQNTTISETFTLRWIVKMPNLLFDLHSKTKVLPFFLYSSAISSNFIFRGC